MEAVIFIGIQATGKSTFYQTHFFKTHLRINLDMLKTRHREQILFKACLEAKQALVVDNTNPTITERKRYLELAKKAGFKVIGYYFQSELESAIKRNEARQGKEKIPLVGLKNTHARLQLPSLIEGFDLLYYVRLDTKGQFVIEEWQEDEI